MKIIIPTQFKKLIGEDEISSDAESILSLFDELCNKYNGLKERLISVDGTPNKYINIYINDEDIRFLEGINSKLKTDDVVSIIPSTAGG